MLAGELRDDEEPTPTIVIGKIIINVDETTVRRDIKTHHNYPNKHPKTETTAEIPQRAT